MAEEATTIILKNGKKIKRVIRINPQGRRYVRYNGRNIGVEYSCGEYYQIYD